MTVDDYRIRKLGRIMIYLEREAQRAEWIGQQTRAAELWETRDDIAAQRSALLRAKYAPSG